MLIQLTPRSITLLGTGLRQDDAVRWDVYLIGTHARRVGAAGVARLAGAFRRGLEETFDPTDQSSAVLASTT